MKQLRPSTDDIEEKEQTFNNRTGGTNTRYRNNIEDRPITPMRGTYRQVAEKFGDEDDYPYNDRSPTRERESLKSSRIMSASQRLTMNSMSRTIDPRYAVNYQEQKNNISPSRTIGSATRQRTSLNASIDDSKLLNLK